MTEDLITPGPVLDSGCLDAEGQRRMRGWVAVTSHPVTSHPLDGVDAEDVEAFGHDGCCGFTEQHPPHVDLHHLTWGEKNYFILLFLSK